MINLRKKIEERIRLLETIMKGKLLDIEKAPEGILNIARSGNRVQYYYKKESKDKTRKYLKIDQKSLVKALCQKDYDEKVLKNAEKEYKILKELHKIAREFHWRLNNSIYR